MRRTTNPKRVAASISKAIEADTENRSGFVQWALCSDYSFKGCPRTAPSLPPGVYVVQSMMDGVHFCPTNMKSDDLLRFEDPTHSTIISEIDDFWSRKEKYSKMGFLHNRALLMYGPPGSGKSCISKIVIDDVVKRGNIVINTTNLYDLVGGLKALREIESDRQILVLMEDLDGLGGEAKLLSLLDGEDTVDNIMYLATTNYIERLPPRVLRPGRFDRKILVESPPRAGRVAYLQNKLGNSPLINQLADATDGFSFAHMRELLVGIFCLEQNIDTVLKRLHSADPENLGESFSDNQLAKAIKANKATAKLKTTASLRTKRALRTKGGR